MGSARTTFLYAWVGLKASWQAKTTQAAVMAALRCLPLLGVLFLVLAVDMNWFDAIRLACMASLYVVSLGILAWIVGKVGSEILALPFPAQRWMGGTYVAAAAILVHTGATQNGFDEAGTRLLVILLVGAVIGLTALATVCAVGWTRQARSTVLALAQKGQDSLSAHQKLAIEAKHGRHRKRS